MRKWKSGDVLQLPSEISDLGCVCSFANLNHFVEGFMDYGNRVMTFFLQ